MDDQAPTSALLSPKARALAGLSPAERQDLLAAAGLLGLASDDDDFWFLQASVTQLKTLLGEARAGMAETREIASSAMEEARTIAKALKPSAELAAGHIRQTVKGVQDELTAKAAAVVATKVAVEVRRELQSRTANEGMSSKIAGQVFNTVALAGSCAFGITLGQHGWSLPDVPNAILSAGVPGLLIGLAVLVAGAWFLAFKSHR